MFWWLLYALIGWGTVFTPLHVTIGVRVYVLDLILGLLLLRAAFMLVLTRQPLPPLRWFVAYELLVVALAGYGVAKMGNPAPVVAGQTRVFGFYAAAFVASFIALRGDRDLRAFQRWGVAGIVTILAIAAFRLVTGKGYAADQFSSNLDDVQRYLSYYEAGVVSTFYYWVLVRTARRRHIPLWQWWLAAGVAAALLVSNYRSVWLATIVISGGFLLWESRHSLARASRLIAFGVTAAGLLYGVTRFGYQHVVRAKFNAANLSGAVGGRLTMWVGAMARIRMHPFFGNGMGFFKVFQGHINTLHNDFLQLLQNFGLIGTLVAAFLLFRLCRAPGPLPAPTAELQNYRDMRTAIRLAILGVCAVSLLEPFLLQPSTVIVLFAVLGIETKFEWLLHRAAIPARRTRRTAPLPTDSGLTPAPSGT